MSSGSLLRQVTCLFLEKGAFQTCLHDKAFHKLMEQATLQRAYYREHRSAEEQLLDNVNANLG